MNAGYSQRLQTLALGHSGNAFIAYGFDYGVYGFTIATLGPLRGGLLMVVVSFLLDLALIRFYDRSRTDWLGIETLKDLRENAGETRLQKLVHWLLKKGDSVALVLLSFKLDPFAVMLYLRHGAYQFNGMNRRDWSVFIASTLIGNLYWIFVMYWATTGLEQAWTAWNGRA